MKEKLQNFVTAARIVSQLPGGSIKKQAIEELFGKSLSQLELPVGSYAYNKSDLDEMLMYQFICNNKEENFEVVMSVTIDEDIDNFSIIANFS